MNKHKLIISLLVVSSMLALGYALGKLGIYIVPVVS